jgi:hypothetical protein
VRSAGEGLRSGHGWLRRRLFEPDYPLIALEVRPHSLGVVRLLREGKRLLLGAAASLDLPAGALTLSMTHPNITDAAAFGKTLATVVERAGALSGGEIGLVLPDPVVRLALLPAPEVTGRGRRETEDLIRFRLKKALPFEAREARVAHRAPPPGSGGQVLVAAVFRPVLEGYEAALQDLGFRPGLVEAACLTLSGRAIGTGSPGDRLFLNWDHGYVSLVLSRGGWPILLRTLTGDFAAAPDPVIREVANTVLYYRERLEGPGLETAVVRSAALPPEEAVALLHEPLGLKPEILDPWVPFGGSDFGPAAQALAGAAACVARAA